MLKVVPMPTLLEFPSRILVVEDDPTIRQMLRKTFEAHCEVLEAEDGATGLRLMREQVPDFVITDLMIPGVPGVQLIERARRAYWGTLVPILVLTANTREGVLLDCFRRGADDFMIKPFSLQELRIRVSSMYLRQRVARDRSPLTGLPGNTAIRREVEQRLAEGQSFCFATLDIDHFKAFNDTRGFDAGDEVIILVAKLLNQFAASQGDDNTFVGHIGGDDFVALLKSEQVEELATFVHSGFAAATSDYYAQDELETGSVDIINRHGDSETVPLLSVSIGVVPSDRPGLHDYRRLAEVATEIKKVAKSTPGNSLFVDRRTDYLK
jgi:diguanylate cyclase (GGDEF)-like protein